MTQPVTLVTGATRGIGKAIALELGRAGAILVGTATSDAGAQSISDYLQAEKITGVGMCLDVSNQEQTKTVVKQATEQFGAPTVLVNNAGITRDNLLLRMNEQEWDEIMETNFKSAYRLSKACLRGMMKARFGRIINISSVVAATGNPGQSNYAAAKAGLIGFTKSLASEVASRNITVNAVAPGFIKTDMTDALDEEQNKELLMRIPLGRMGEAQEIAHAVAFLASDKASYITGSTLHVNGGMYMN